MSVFVATSYEIRLGLLLTALQRQKRLFRWQSYERWRQIFVYCTNNCLSAARKKTRYLTVICKLLFFKKSFERRKLFGNRKWNKLWRTKVAPHAQCQRSQLKKIWWSLCQVQTRVNWFPIVVHASHEKHAEHDPVHVCKTLQTLHFCSRLGKKYTFHSDLSHASKADQSHHNWHESVKLQWKLSSCKVTKVSFAHAHTHTHTHTYTYTHTHTHTHKHTHTEHTHKNVVSHLASVQTYIKTEIKRSDDRFVLYCPVVFTAKLQVTTGKDRYACIHHSSAVIASARTTVTWHIRTASLVFCLGRSVHTIRLSG